MFRPRKSGIHFVFAAQLARADCDRGYARIVYFYTYDLLIRQPLSDWGVFRICAN